MKYIVAILLLSVISCKRDYNPKEEYVECLRYRMLEFGSSNIAKTITAEMLKQAQEACSPILVNKLQCPPSN